MASSHGSTSGDSPQTRYERAACQLYSAGVCRSCSLLGHPEGSRVAAKLQLVTDHLSRHGVPLPSLPAIVLPSTPWGSRTKVKMSVTGSVDSPVIGVVRSDLSTIELARCPLSPQPFQSLLETVRALMPSANLVPYDIQKRRGELKGLIVMSDRDSSEGILRFVLRSSEAIPRIQKLVPTITQSHPWIRVVSCNIQPLPAAILEGPEEVILTSCSQIEVSYGEISLFFSPQSFMQVTPEVAAALYQQARMWAQEGPSATVLDLFCGAGGFSLSLAPLASSVVGVEISEMAVQSAALAAQRLGYADRTAFIASDVDAALESLRGNSYDLVIMNPPRRGLSETAVERIAMINPARIIYSSCSPETFARDVAAWSGRFRLSKLAPFDMFPLTEHCEVLGLLERA